MTAAPLAAVAQCGIEHKMLQDKAVLSERHGQQLLQASACSLLASYRDADFPTNTKWRRGFIMSYRLVKLTHSMKLSNQRLGNLYIYQIIKHYFVTNSIEGEREYM